jgi:iron complex outermembrane receptor protein
MSVVNGVGLARNADEAEVYGVELEVLARPISELTIGGNIAYLDATYTKYEDAFRGITQGDASGNQMIQSPEWSLNLHATYVMPVGKLGYLSLRGAWSWVDDVYFTELMEECTKQDAYSIVNLLARFEPPNGRWAFSLYANNLFDEEYWSSMTSDSLAGASNGLPGKPQTFGAELSFKF